MHKLIIREESSGVKKVLKNVQPFQTLLEICLDHNVDIRHQCGGVCHCTTCVVHVMRGNSFLDEPSKREIDFLKKNGTAGPGARLACQSMLQDGRGEIEILIPVQDDV